MSEDKGNSRRPDCGCFNDAVRKLETSNKEKMAAWTQGHESCPTVQDAVLSF